MSDNVVFLGTETSLDIPVERVCDAAKESCKSVFIIGEDADGCVYLASSAGDKPQLLWLLKLAEQALLEDV